ncbi:MAG: DsbA family oxidoreductase [Pseudomonadota bacterium]
MATEPPIRVDIVSDVVCPWCIIGYRQLAKAASETGIEIDAHWHPFELNPHMGEDGQNLQVHLAEKYGTTPEASAKARARLTEMGTALGFAFRYADDMRMVNTFRAHQLIDWAEDFGRSHDAKMALFEAFFTRRENLNDIDQLGNVAATLGLEREAAMACLRDGVRAHAVRQKQQFWTSRGIQGVPAMVFMGRHLVTGAQGEDTYARILEHLSTDEAA